MYDLAKEYYLKNGNLKINSRYVIHLSESNINLGDWINYQRKMYKQGKLSRRKIELLENIGMIWSFSNSKVLKKEM